MTAPLDLFEQPLDHVGRANRPSVFSGKGIEGQARVQVAVQALNRGRVGLFILGAKGRHRWIGLRPIVLVEDGPQFRVDLVLRLLGNVGQNILQLVLHAALPGGVQEFGCHRIEHGRSAIRNPQADRLDAAGFQVVQKLLPGCAGCFPYPLAQRELIGLADRFWQELRDRME